MCLCECTVAAAAAHRAHPRPRRTSVSHLCGYFHRLHSFFSSSAFLQRFHALTTLPGRLHACGRNERRLRLNKGSSVLPPSTFHFDHSSLFLTFLGRSFPPLRSSCNRILRCLLFHEFSTVRRFSSVTRTTLIPSELIRFSCRRADVETKRGRLFILECHIKHFYPRILKKGAEYRAVSHTETSSITQRSHY